jgi:hypothetical protein
MGEFFVLSIYPEYRLSGNFRDRYFFTATPEAPKYGWAAEND